MLTTLQYRMLRRFWPTAPKILTGAAYIGKSKVKVLLGEQLISDIQGKVVIDFGCGRGDQAIELALAGAKRVVGIDIRESFLQEARERARRAGVDDRCVFTTTPEPADAIVSLDSFEHFDEPYKILQTMYDDLLPRGGFVATSFGPTWYHPYGGHTFSMFPWAHLVFAEKALVRWRADFQDDGATRFSEVSGGLNQMTIGRFERLVAASPFRLEFLEAVPIRRLKHLHNRLTREFTTAIVRAKLLK